MTFFKEKGLTVTEINKDDFRDAVLKNVTFESFRLSQGRLGSDPGHQVDPIWTLVRAGRKSLGGTAIARSRFFRRQHEKRADVDG